MGAMAATGAEQSTKSCAEEPIDVGTEVPTSEVGAHSNSDLASLPPTTPAGPHMLADQPDRLWSGTVYHEPWWLDATTDGAWKLLSTEYSGFVARLPIYSRRTLFGDSLITNPPLTRTLGPVFERISRAHQFTDRIARRLTAELAAQIPPKASFAQIFAPETPGIFSFASAGFQACADYTYRLAGALDEKALWGSVHNKARRQIRRAQERFSIDDAVSVEEFVEFYAQGKRAQQKRLVPSGHVVSELLREAVTRFRGRLVGCRTATGLLASAIFIALDANSAYFVMSARIPGIADSGAVAMLAWHEILWSRAAGLQFDFDGSNQFLGQFGAEPFIRWKVMRISRMHRALSWAGLAHHY